MIFTSKIKFFSCSTVSEVNYTYKLDLFQNKNIFFQQIPTFNLVSSVNIRFLPNVSVLVKIGPVWRNLKNTDEFPEKTLHT